MTAVPAVPSTPTAPTTPALSHDLILRPITGSQEVELFNQLPYVFNHEVADDLSTGRRRHAWLWVALRGDRVLARVGWWCRPGDDAPLLFDILDYAEDHQDVGQLLFETAQAAVFPRTAPRSSTPA